MTRLRRVAPERLRWRRVRSGRGFRYLDEHGRPLTEEQAQRIRALAIPPAWRDVRICAEERGHLQAVGVDSAGRLQYLYHPEWRRRRDLEKFDRVLALAEALPRARRRTAAALRGDPLERDTVLALAVRLLDLGCFRVGSREYAERNGSHGLTTLERRHVRRRGGDVVFSFTGKSGVEQRIEVGDPAVARVVEALTRGRAPASPLLAYRQGRRRRPVDPAELNDHLRGLLGAQATAKDLRTWHATVAAALALAGEERATTRAGRDRQVRAAMEAAADLLGNTPAVARSAYVDPRVVERFEEGRPLALPPSRRTASRDALDRAVAALLR